VLGCTHYPFVAEELRRHAGPIVRIIDTGAPVAQQTRRLLDATHTLAGKGDDDIATVLETSGTPEALAAAASRWLHRPAALAC